LFANLTDVERLFFEPEGYPWEALLAMFKLTAECAGILKTEPLVKPVRDWPACLPLFDAEKKDPSTPINFVAMERRIHIRGGDGLKSDQNVHIHGPVILGKNVTLRKGAVVTGPSYIGDGVVIGQGCRIKNSIIRSGAEIQFGTRLAHSVLGRRVFVGANAALSDTQPMPGKILVPDHSGPNIETDLEELGLMAGDHCWIGCGAVIAAAVILERKMRVREGARIREAGVALRTDTVLHVPYID
jgi:NDP-sugar pyrophosphorylase family protein